MSEDSSTLKRELIIRGQLFSIYRWRSKRLKNLTGLIVFEIFSPDKPEYRETPPYTVIFFVKNERAKIRIFNILDNPALVAWW